MVEEIAYLRTIAEIIPSPGSDTSGAHGLAVAGSIGEGGGASDPTLAEGVDDDERTDRQRDQRHQWTDRNGDRAGDFERPTKCARTGQTAGSSGACQRGGTGAEFRRELARGRAVRNEQGDGGV